MSDFRAMIFLAAFGLVNAPAEAQPQAHQDRLRSVGRGAGEIASQPVRDVGAAKRAIPPVLVSAARAPYGIAGVSTCPQISASVRALNVALGPDFTVGAVYHENRAGKLAEAGGKTVINSLIPFRGLVREVSGAAPAQRRLNAAIDAGFARRGFLRGLHLARGCKTPI